MLIRQKTVFISPGLAWVCVERAAVERMMRSAGPLFSQHQSKQNKTIIRKKEEARRERGSFGFWMWRRSASGREAAKNIYIGRWYVFVFLVISFIIY